MPYADVPSRTSRQFYYEDTGGAGPVIVFSHGFMMDHEMFAPQIEALSAQYRCITWDQRGHGLTATDRLSPFDFYDSANDLSNFLDFLGVPPAILVGMSQGGFVTLRTALSNPDAVAAMILIDTEAGVMPGPEINGNEQLLNMWITNGFSQVLGEIIAAQIIGPGDGQPLWPGAQAWIDKWSQDKLVNLIPSFNALIDRRDVTSILGAIKKPALVIHGELDKSIAPAMGQALAAGLGVTCQMIPGAGHASNLTHPAQVNPLIEAFLTTLALLPPPTPD
ncbi:alpha/beta hydrolase [Phenylobacterium sp.]|jgi:pimeloyl-ACP methyl ester carboxylesterase|uniref:alpha/beta fold hydrolase n=1 Tax=Phenylobacterium sp. TaxID=1871053 RepID=UPI002E3561F9|nr:alpha/beta hydrolase [Phenylobacterium sp.]HEX4711592.1 alpha/beta hydrolase [Phenylobacterium sp.]